MKINPGRLVLIGIICIVILGIKGLNSCLHKETMQILENNSEWQNLLNQYLPATHQTTNSYTFKNKNDVEKEGLKGKVRFAKFEAKEYARIGKSKPFPGAVLYGGYYEFDSLGNKILEFYFDVDFYSIDYKKKKYVYVGNMKSVEYTYSGLDTLISRYSINYADHTITEDWCDKRRNCQLVYRTVYDEYGRKQSYQYEDSIEFKVRETYEYDTAGNMIRSFEHKDGKITRYKIYGYDRYNNLIKKDEYVLDINAHSSVRYSYNELNELVLREETSYSGETDVYFYTDIKKDKYGNILYINTYKNGELYSCRTVEFGYYE